MCEYCPTSYNRLEECEEAIDQDNFELVKNRVNFFIEKHTHDLNEEILDKILHLLKYARQRKCCQQIEQFILSKYQEEAVGWGIDIENQDPLSN